MVIQGAFEIMTTISLVRSASARTCLSLGLLLTSGSILHAQPVSSGPSPAAAGQSDLSPVVVTAPPKRARRASRPSRRTRAVQNVPASPAPTRVDPDRIDPQPERETANGPIRGYVAQQSATGTKTDTRILENPQSISVVGRQQIEQQGAQTVAESLRYTAGVVAGSRPGNRFDDIFIRGFGGFGFTAGYVQFLDGLKMQRGVSYAIPSIDPYGLERVEVIKGPASVLYGQSNPGGLVNMVSKRPTEHPFHEIEFLAGNYSRLQAAFDIGGPLDPEGKFLYRVTGLGLNSSTSVDFTDEQRVFIAPALTWRPNNDTSITFLSHYQKDPKSFQPNYLPAQGLLPGTPGVPANPYGKLPTSFYIGDPSHDSYRREWASTGYEFAHRFSDVWMVRQNLRYQHVDSEFYAIPANPGYADASDPTTIRRAKTAVDEVFDGVVIDNQAEAKFNTGMISHKVLFGVDYQYTNARRLLGQSRSVPPPERAQSGIRPEHLARRVPDRPDPAFVPARRVLAGSDEDRPPDPFGGRAARHFRNSVQHPDAGEQRKNTRQSER
jgi:iron complex outermembrane receptor protein